MTKPSDQTEAVDVEVREGESAPRSSDCYTAYRAAGEVFGRLRQALGFGELVMFTRTCGQSASPRAVSFQWAFKAADQRYCCEENVTMIELTNLRSLEAFANHLCDKWKNEHRKTTAKPEAV